MKLPNVLWVVEYVTEATDGADAEHAQDVFAVTAEDSLKMPEALLLKVAKLRRWVRSDVVPGRC